MSNNVPQRDQDEVESDSAYDCYFDKDEHFGNWAVIAKGFTVETFPYDFSVEYSGWAVGGIVVNDGTTAPVDTAVDPLGQRTCLYSVILRQPLGDEKFTRVWSRLLPVSIIHSQQVEIRTVLEKAVKEFIHDEEAEHVGRWDVAEYDKLRGLLASGHELDCRIIWANRDVSIVGIDRSVSPAIIGILAYSTIRCPRIIEGL